MTFGKPLYGICKLKITKFCLSFSGEKTLIVNKGRMACLICNDIVKRQKKAEKRESNASLRDRLRGELSRMVIPKRAHGRLADMDAKFYREVWDSKKNWKGACICQECSKILPEYSSAFISHIISRGAETRLRWDKRNVNILCLEHHQQWETGDRKSMNIYINNLNIIEVLKISLINELHHSG